MILQNPLDLSNLRKDGLQLIIKNLSTNLKNKLCPTLQRMFLLKLVARNKLFSTNFFFMSLKNYGFLRHSRMCLRVFLIWTRSILYRFNRDLKPHVHLKIRQ
jgi:hypothetical protein